jgi:phosphoglycolate phosphatase-like HAD superfamily hydrolase
VRDIAIFDVDGTLVDSNYQTVVAWYRAFRSFGIVLPAWQLHRHVGMGGDKYVPAVAGEQVNARLGDEIREAWGREYDALIGEVSALEGTAELLAAVRDRGFSVVLASSGKAKHVERYLELFDGRQLADAWTTSADVEQTKPAPDLLGVALNKIGAGDDGSRAVFVGDTPYDAEAATELQIPTIGVLTGGFPELELRAAGAVAVYQSPKDLLDDLDSTLLAKAG